MPHPHFLHVQDPGSPPPPTNQLPAAAFAQALDHLVIGCVDLVFTHQDQILLAHRRHLPRQTWWLIGGRMIAGESPLATARRKAQQEAGLILPEAQPFNYLGTFSTGFAHRHQPPQEGGLHSLNITYHAPLTASLRHQLQLSAADYIDWQWVHPQTVAHLFPTPSPMDRLLLSILAQIPWQT